MVRLWWCFGGRGVWRGVGVEVLVLRYCCRVGSIVVVMWWCVVIVVVLVVCG